MAQAIAGKQFPFLWEGKDRKGNRIKGRGLAKDEAELRTDLRRQGIAVRKVRKERHFLKSDGKIKGEDIALFSRQLSTMLTAGIPMVQAFEIIGVGHDKPAMQKLVLSIKKTSGAKRALSVSRGARSANSGASGGSTTLGGPAGAMICQVKSCVVFASSRA